jgi:hypothetical protein
MRTNLEEVVRYELKTKDSWIQLNDWIGSEVTIKFCGQINCLACNKITPKSYSGGYCYQCLQSLPQTDMCMVKPELCHFSRGTCRDEEWGKKNCFKKHSVYLARSSAIKVGITSENPPETRWMDQGAIEAMVIAEVPDRKTSGLVETAIAAHIHDKTDFRKMLRGEVAEGKLEDTFDTIVDSVPENLKQYILPKRDIVHIQYPLIKHPEKIKTTSLDKQNEIKSELNGIKGQYLIFKDFVFNVRGHGGYLVQIEGEANPNPVEFEKIKEEKEPTLFDFF